MSRETRTVRPFVGLDSLKQVLEETRLLFGKHVCPAGDGIVVEFSPEAFVSQPVSLEWSQTDGGFSEFVEDLLEASDKGGFGPEDLHLMVIASSPYLRIADTLIDVPVGRVLELGRVTSLTDLRRSPAFRTPFSGFALEASVILAHDLEPRPLRPHLKGTWVTRARYLVETSAGPAIMTPTPLTDDTRKELTLPPRAIRFISFGEHNVFEPFAQQEAPVFYVDEKLLAQLNARRRSAASRAVQLQMAYDFVGAVIRRAAAAGADEFGSYDELRLSLVGSVVRLVAGPGAAPAARDRLVEMVRESPEKVIAGAEHAIDLLAGFADLLEDGDS